MKGLRPSTLRFLLWQTARRGGAFATISLIGGWPSLEDIEALERCWSRNLQRRAKLAEPPLVSANVRHTGDAVVITLGGR